MKEWKVDFTKRFKDGREVECGRVIEARTIRDALEQAERICEDEEANNENVDRIVIWNVCIVQDDVF